MALDPFCDFCETNNEEETAMHILTECNAFSKIRQESFGYHKLSLNTLLENTKTATAIHTIIKLYFKKNQSLLHI